MRSGSKAGTAAAAESIGAALARGTRALQTAGVPGAARDARILLSHATQATLNQLICAPEKILTPDEQRTFTAAVAARARRQPVSQIIGWRDFYGLRFRVGPAVLDPRPETEVLVAAAVDALDAQGLRDRPARILDLGVGSGCVLLTLLREAPQATGVGIDVSEDSLKIARHNADDLDVADRAMFLQGDWLEGVDEAFDLVVSNPPYIANSERGDLSPDVLKWEPEIALFGGDDGLKCYQRIAEKLPQVMAPNAAAAFEFGHQQAQDVTRVMEDAGLRRVGLRCDADNRPRCAVFTTSNAGRR